MGGRPGLVGRSEGAVYVEFLVVFMPIFILWLGMTQVGLLFAAKMVVQHAADSACRAAIVVLPDDPQYYGDTDAYQLDFNDTRSPDWIAGVVGMIAEMMGVTDNIHENWVTAGDERLNAVRLAAFFKTLPLAPYLDSLTQGQAKSVYDAIDSDMGRMATGLIYNLAALSVTFPQSTSPTATASTNGSVSFSDNGPVTTRVTYLYTCSIPLASRIMCDPYNDLSGSPGWQELNGAITPVLGDAASALGLVNGNYAIIRAQTTMMIQGAPYEWEGGS